MQTLNKEKLSEEEFIKNNRYLINRVYFDIFKNLEYFKNNEEEIIQIGNVGLLNSYRSYDDNKGKVSTHSYYCILTEFNKYIRKDLFNRYNNTSIEESDISNMFYKSDTYNLDSLNFKKEPTELQLKVFKLFFNQGYTTDDIAELCNISKRRVNYIIKQTVSKYDL